ncbi:diacylglycerol/polyprenol kinase family protein [Elusimicrobiota bacterium]
MYRKLYHLCGLIFPLLVVVLSRKVSIYISGSLFVIVLVFDLFRLQWKEFNLLIIKRLPIRFKRKEVKSISGSPYFLGGVFFTLLLFDPVYAAGGIIFLSIGDLSAVVIGKRFGKIKIFDKTLEGAFAFALSTLIVLLLLKYFGVLNLNITGIIAGSVICAAVELMNPGIDDNLLIPLVGAFVLKILG